MNLNIRAHHVSITDPIKEYVEKKIGKLDKFFNHIHEINIDVDVSEASNHAPRHTVTATVLVPGTLLRAQEESKDIYSSIDLLYDKLEKQVSKYKEKLRDNRRKSNKRSLSRNGRAKVVSNQNQKDKPARYVKKPMHVEDAVSTMELHGFNFLVFRNAETEEINIIYIEDDGELNLIEP